MLQSAAIEDPQNTSGSMNRSIPGQSMKRGRVDEGGVDVVGPAHSFLTPWKETKGHNDGHPFKRYGPALLRWVTSDPRALLLPIFLSPCEVDSLANGKNGNMF